MKIRLLDNLIVYFLLYYPRTVHTLLYCTYMYCTRYCTVLVIILYALLYILYSLQAKQYLIIRHFIPSKSSKTPKMRGG